MREVILRTGHAESRHAHEERHNVRIARRYARHTWIREGDAVTIPTSSARSMVVRGYSIVDLRRGFESLYVYSSLVEPRIVGDKIVRLLRIVLITRRHWEMITARFDHVQYILTMRLEFGTVETDKRRAA